MASLIFSSSRLIAKGFATKPATPGSLSTSCALASSAFPGNKKQRRNFSHRMTILINFANQKKQHRAIDHRHLKIEDGQVVFFLQRELERVLRLGRGIDFTPQRCHQRFTY